jgi:hypothetical protein
MIGLGEAVRRGSEPPAAPASVHFDASVVLMVDLRFQGLLSVSAQIKAIMGGGDIRGLCPLLALPAAP